jgi:hypothetical protein
VALSRVKELRLTDAKLVELYESELGLWRDLAAHAYTFAKTNIAGPGEIRPDDVVPVLRPVLEVTPALRSFLAARNLRQQYWYEWFAELILDRLWPELERGAGGKEAR